MHSTKEHLENRKYFLSCRVHIIVDGGKYLVDYADLKGKSFFPGLIKYMASGPVVGMVWEGLDAVKTGRAMLGATNPLQSPIGTLRTHISVSSVVIFKFFTKRHYPRRLLPCCRP